MHPIERRNHSVGLRIWHWLDALVVIGLIVTYFLRNALVSSNRFFADRLGANGIVVDQTTLRQITHQRVDQLWTWHIDLGYALTALLILRVILFFTDKANPVKICWDSICVMRSHFDFRNIHSAIVKSGYVVFYILQLFMVMSGLTLTYGEALALSKTFKDLVHESHEAVMWFFLAFVVVHIIGVFVAENSDDRGIVSAMINGDS